MGRFGARGPLPAALASLTPEAAALVDILHELGIDKAELDLILRASSV